MSSFEIALSVALGIALAAAVGFRVFLPLLVVSVAARAGYLHVGEGFVWLASLPAVIMLAVAAVTEVLAYYIPAVDNLLDTITTPSAIVAGVLVSAAMMADLPPLVKWTTAIIAGGGAAGITQTTTALLRAKSTAFTGGTGNAVVATGELGAATLLSLLALLAPVIALAAVLLFCWLVLRYVRKLRRRAADTKQAELTRLPREPGA